jgi:elongator complex protein 3
LLVAELHSQPHGPALALGADSQGEAQHRGLGRRLVELACRIARSEGFSRIAVIAAVGTRPYYRRLGFELDELYMSRAL